MHTGHWFTTLKQASASRLTLVFFHHAGGNSGFYRELSKLIASDVRIVAIDLPGRGKRFNEPLIDDLDHAADEIEQALLRERVAVPTHSLVFFGHSVGAKLAFAVTQRLERAGAVVPAHLIISGSRAPHLPRLKPMTHDLPKSELIRELHNYGSTPESVLADDDLLDLLIPMLRSDFKMAEKYLHKNTAPVACDLSVFGGDADNTVESESLYAWSGHTKGSCEVQLFPGGHFFLHQDEYKIAGAIDAVLAKVMHRAATTGLKSVAMDTVGGGA
ncbi:thioesterase II family protein [Dyella tabacisoli]|uniref:Thioesterase n=1 Tax=Dyella tabacisoli TaxID=2282381 RepID=A0A369UKT6_9GAMM|nr:alpha/beta fold hydrolase [Dyella tabacisoli]RDD80210.1 thioesterase [Dyella tabacisoli]